MSEVEFELVQYSVVVPVYESDQSVVELVERLQRVIQHELCATYEIILVDDGSKSRTTWPTLQSLAAQNRQVTAIRLMRNYGKAAAMLCGLGRAKGRWIISIDDDLQQRPEDIPALVEFEDHDVVVANFEDRQHDFLTVLGSRVKNLFDRWILRLPCEMSPLKLFKAEVAQGMLEIKTPRPFIPALMAYATSDFVPVIVPHEVSRHGQSRYNLWRRLKQFSNLVIGNSSILLRFVGLFGGAVAFVGLFLALSAVTRKLFGIPVVPGWTSIIVINLTFGGLTLLVLGLLGEYLIRILEGSSRKPAFLIREVSPESNSKLNSRQPNLTQRAGHAPDDPTR